MYIENLTLQYQLETIKSDTDFFSMVNHKDIVWLDGYSFNEDFKANLRSRVYMLAETNDLPQSSKCGYTFQSYSSYKR